MSFNFSTWIRPSITHRLFNPNLRRISQDFNAEAYVLVSASEQWADPETGARPYPPGETPVIPKGRHHKFDNNGKLIGAPITAEEVLEYMVGKDGLSGKLTQAGVRLMSPDGDQNGINDAIKTEAMEVAQRYQYDQDTGLIASHEAENKKLVELHMPPKLPTQQVREAYRRKAMVDAAQTALPFECPQCFDRSATQQQLRSHIESLHPTKAGALIDQAGLVPVEVVASRGGKKREGSEATA